MQHIGKCKRNKYKKKTIEKISVLMRACMLDREKNDRTKNQIESHSFDTFKSIN